MVSINQSHPLFRVVNDEGGEGGGGTSGWWVIVYD